MKAFCEDCGSTEVKFYHQNLINLGTKEDLQSNSYLNKKEERIIGKCQTCGSYNIIVDKELYRLLLSKFPNINIEIDVKILTDKELAKFYLETLYEFVQYDKETMGEPDCPYQKGDCVLKHGQMLLKIKKELCDRDIQIASDIGLKLVRLKDGYWYIYFDCLTGMSFKLIKFIDHIV